MSSFELIDAATAAGSEEPFVFIDTREPSAYAAGHLPGAVNIRDIFTYECGSSPQHLHALQQHFSQLFGAAGLSGRERAIVYEEAANTGNGQSSRGCFLLHYLGYPKIALLDGGLRAWAAAGYPTSNEVPTVQAKTFPLAFAPDCMATRDDLMQALDEPDVAIVDVRDAAEWYGTQSAPTGHNPEIRCGRIPGAVWIQWRDFIDDTSPIPRLKSASEILAICRNKNIEPTQPVLLYCYKGARAASSFIALRKAGFISVRNYFASWNEWGRDTAMPIENSRLAFEAST
jgi:thiosulfate/3-mercaptopyruvate sulfurtransferase